MAKGAPLGQLIVELGLDETRFRAGIQGTKNELKFLESSFKTSQSVLETFGKKVTGAAKPMDILNQQLNAQRALVSELKQQYINSIDATGKATAKTESYARQLESARGDLAKYVGQVKETAKQQYLATSGLAKFSDGAGKVGDKLRAAGNAMMPVSVGLTGIFYNGVKAAAGFEQQFTAIRALLSDGTPEKTLNGQINQLEQSSKNWATQYGIATEDINTGIEEMIKKGYNFNQTLGAMPAILDASKASGDDFNTVMSTSTSILEQFGLRANDTAQMTKNTTRVTDSLSFVANETAAGFSDMGTAMTYVGPVAHSLGMSVEETASAIGLLSNNGIEGDKAGTALRGALSRLLKPTKQSSAAFQELGIDVDAFKKGQLTLPDILDKIKTSTNGMTAAQKSSLMAMAFGTEAQSGMNILVSQGGDALRKLSSETQKASGYTKDLADKMSNSASNSFAKAKAQLEVLSINLGEKLLPALIPFVKTLSNIADGFSKLSPEAQKTITTLAGVAAVSYPALNALGNLSNILGFIPGKLASWGSKISGMKAFKDAEEAAGLTGKAIAGVGTAAGTAEEGVGLLAGGLSGTLPIALGVAGVALAGFAIWKLTEGIRNSQQSISDFGADIDKTTQKKLEPMKTSFEHLQAATTVFDGVAVKNVGDVTNAINGMATAATNSINTLETATTKYGKEAGMTDAQIADSKKVADQQKANVQSMADQVTQIYKNAAAKGRNLNADELAIVSNNEKQLLQTTINNYGVHGNKAKELMAAFSGDMSKMSDSSLENINKEIVAMGERNDKQYKSDLDTLQKNQANYDKGTQQYKNYTTEITALKNKHNAEMKSYATALVNEENEVYKRALTNAASDNTSYETVQNNRYVRLREEFSKLGIDFDKTMANMAKSGKKGAKEFGDNSDQIAQYTTKMSADGKKASDNWNSIIFNPKTGKVDVVGAEKMVATMSQTEAGWAQIKFDVKNANMTTNARETVEQGLIQSNKWNSLSIADKELVLGNTKAVKAVMESSANLAVWNSMKPEDKELLLKNQKAMLMIANTKGGLEAWNNLSAKEKELKVKDLTTEPKKKAQATINSLTGKTVGLGAKDGTKTGKDSAQSTVNSLKGASVGLFANDYASAIAISVSNLLNNIPRIVPIAINVVGDLKSILGLKNGTENFTGDLAWVNDQKGRLYKELITLPTGQSFVPQARDVILPLPKGSKILKASQTAKLIPKYASGIGPQNIPADAEIFKKMDRVQNSITIKQNSVDHSSQLNKIIQLLQLLDNGNLVKAVKESSNHPVVGIFDANSVSKALAPSMTTAQANLTARNNRMRGVLNS